MKYHIHKGRKFFNIIVIVSLLFLQAYITPRKRIPLAKSKNSLITICIKAHVAVPVKFAASELSKYLKKISGAVFTIDSLKDISTPAINLNIDPKLTTESYVIQVSRRNIIIRGGSGRAVLYAVYDFLHKLGCMWLAPGFSFYKGQSEYIPHKPDLYYNASHAVHSHPAFAYRKLDVEEGRTHNTENLKQIIDWMPKLRFNTLMVPLDYGGSGRVKWDNWRKELTPELKKRGLIIEVGGHGYQNFLNADMPAISSGSGKKTLFDEHPEWFGKDKNCQPSPKTFLVFNTENDSAVNYFLHNISTYIEKHPEINIFDCWPPDGARWDECPESAKSGFPQDRQAILMNKVDDALKGVRSNVQLEIIAYARALLPPDKVQLNRDILVDFCPIDQTFEKQIYDSSAGNNNAYKNAILAWHRKFHGHIGLYSYYRKYAWKSLPNIIPHYIKRDLQWYAQVPLQGISVYSEPGDWGTYELNYYVLGHLAWNTNCNVDALINQFCHIHYGPYWRTAKEIYTSLENIVRNYCSVPFTTLKSPEQIAQAEKKLAKNIYRVASILKKNNSDNLSRLLLMLQYADYDLKILEQIASGNKKEAATIVKNLVSFLENNRDKGTFLLSRGNNLANYLRHYHLDNLP